MTRRIPLPALLTLTVCTAVTSRTQAQEPAQTTPGAAVAVNKVPDLSAVPTDGFVLDELRRIVRGFQIAPVPLDLQGKNLALVGLGSYIVNAQGGCNDCHTNPSYAEGGDPFQGERKRVNAERYLAGGTPFGPVTSRNLTPNAQGRPAGYTYNQFLRVLRTGRDLKNLPPHVPSEDNDLLQVMPWPVYQDMIEHDIRALYGCFLGRGAVSCAVDVLEDDDGAVDQHADADGDAAERDDVQRHPREVHERKSGDDADRNGDGDDHGGAQTAQEQEQDEGRQQRADAGADLDVGHRRLDERG